jgi:hypothetical protein
MSTSRAWRAGLDVQSHLAPTFRLLEAPTADLQHLAVRAVQAVFVSVLKFPEALAPANLPTRLLLDINSVGHKPARPTQPAPLLVLTVLLQPVLRALRLLAQAL